MFVLQGVTRYFDTAGVSRYASKRSILRSAVQSFVDISNWRPELALTSRWIPPLHWRSSTRSLPRIPSSVFVRIRTPPRGSSSAGSGRPFSDVVRAPRREASGDSACPDALGLHRVRELRGNHRPSSSEGAVSRGSQRAPDTAGFGGEEQSGQGAARTQANVRFRMSLWGPTPFCVTVASPQWGKGRIHAEKGD
jgi:hypothetical protein